MEITWQNLIGDNRSSLDKVSQSLVDDASSAYYGIATEKRSSPLPPRSRELLALDIDIFYDSCEYSLLYPKASLLMHCTLFFNLPTSIATPRAPNHLPPVSG